MTTYLYIHVTDTNRIDDDLNEYGQQGWRLAFITSDEHTGRLYIMELAEPALTDDELSAIGAEYDAELRDGDHDREDIPF